MSLWSRPGEDGLSASDRLIRDLKREGLPDAEIATRVGVSIAEVKQRLERLAEAPSTPAPKPAKRPAEPERGRPIAASAPGAIELGWLGEKLARHGKLIIGGAILLALAAFIAGYYARGGGAGERETLATSIESGSGLGFGPALQPFSGVSGVTALPGLTVTGSASRTAPADAAYVYVFLQPETSLLEDDRFEILTRLRVLGFGEEALEVHTPRDLPFPIVGVRLPADRVAELGNEVIDLLYESLSVTRNISPGSGVVFTVADCDVALAPLWEEAYRDAEAHAAGIAKATGVDLGLPIAIQEDPLASLLAIYQSSAFAPPCVSGIDDIGDGSFYYGSTTRIPTDPAEVELTANLTLTFALGESASDEAHLLVTGFASASAPATSAYFVALGVNSGLRVRSTDSTENLFDALSELGVPTASVLLDYSPQGYPGVAIPVPLDLSPDDASAIRNALSSFLGTIQSDGIVFGHTACDEILTEAEAAAMRAAKRRAEAIASGAGGRVTSVQSVATISGQGSGCPARPVDGNLVPVGSPAEVQVSAALAVTFAVEPSD